MDPVARLPASRPWICCWETSFTSCQISGRLNFLICKMKGKNCTFWIGLLWSLSVYLAQCLKDDEHPNVGCHHHCDYYHHFYLCNQILIFWHIGFFPLFTITKSVSGNSLVCYYFAHVWFHTCFEISITSRQMSM